jgi:hypothetical protein
MHHLLGRHRADVEAWKKVVESHKEAHLEARLHFQQVWVNADDPNEIFFMFRVEDLEKARSFLEKAGALDQEKQEGGEIPKLWFLESR